LHQATAGWLTQQRTITLMKPGAMRNACRFHEEVYAAIAAHDADGVDARMKAHLLSVERNYWRAVARHAGA
jgi:DNA-binding FadR family transcriptional regulator